MSSRAPLLRRVRFRTIFTIAWIGIVGFVLWGAVVDPDFERRTYDLPLDLAMGPPTGAVGQRLATLEVAGDWHQSWFWAPPQDSVRFRSRTPSERIDRLKVPPADQATAVRLLARLIPSPTR